MPRGAVQRMTSAVQLAATDDLHAQCWAEGRLEPYLHSSERGQVQAWERMWQWYQLDPAAEQAKWSQYSDQVSSRIFCLEVSRRWGKSALCLWWLTRLAILLPHVLSRPAYLRFTTMFQHSIDTIVGRVMNDVYRYAPESCTPTYHGKRGVLPAGLYFPKYGPAAGSCIALAGLEVNPKALRGQDSDGDVVSEAGFIADLEEQIGGVLYAQYQGRPWARMVLESSAPDVLHSSWELRYLPDGKMRGAHFSAVIDDNPLLSEAEKAEFVSAAGGRGNAVCEREYYNVISADATLKVFPEVSEAHVLDSYEQPRHALAFTALDPGFRDMFAVLFAVYDNARGALVVLDCWARSNASTEQVAAVIAAREYDLWGMWPSAKLSRIPLRDVLDDSGRVLQLGWHSLLAGDRCARHADRLHELAGKPDRERPENPASWPHSRYRKTHAFDGMLCHYDHAQGRFDFGVRRVCDVAPQLIHDLSTSYGLSCHTTTKDDLKDTMVWNTRSKWLSRGRLLFTQRARAAYDHINAAVWNEQRTQFDRHPVYSHFDLAAGAVYLTRYVDMHVNINPEPPPNLGVGGPDWVPAWQPTDDSSHYETY
jgi:hypothetical protein